MSKTSWIWADASQPQLTPHHIRPHPPPGLPSCGPSSCGTSPLSAWGEWIRGHRSLSPPSIVSPARRSPCLWLDASKTQTELKITAAVVDEMWALMIHTRSCMFMELLLEYCFSLHITFLKPSNLCKYHGGLLLWSFQLKTEARSPQFAEVRTSKLGQRSCNVHRAALPHRNLALNLNNHLFRQFLSSSLITDLMHLLGSSVQMQRVEPHLSCRSRSCSKKVARSSTLIPAVSAGFLHVARADSKPNNMKAGLINIRCVYVHWHERLQEGFMQRCLFLISFFFFLPHVGSSPLCLLF